MNETRYQRRVVERLELTFPGCIVIRNDPNRIQGLPDLLILYGDSWFMLEIKKSENEPTQPNQEYYVDFFNNMSFAAFLFPENEERVFYELQNTFGSCRATCVSKSKQLRMDQIQRPEARSKMVRSSSGSKRNRPS